MKLKDKKRKEADLRTGAVEYLGVEAYGEQGTVQYEVTEEAWADYKLGLLEVNDKDPEERAGTASNILHGWLSYNAVSEGVTRNRYRGIVWEALSYLCTNTGIDLYDRKGAVGMFYATRIEDWRETVRSTREAYIASRPAPQPHTRARHAADAAPPGSSERPASR